MRVNCPIREMNTRRIPFYPAEISDLQVVGRALSAHVPVLAPESRLLLLGMFCFLCVHARARTGVCVCVSAGRGGMYRHSCVRRTAAKLKPVPPVVIQGEVGMHSRRHMSV